MIIFALIIITILFFVSCNLILKNKWLHLITAVISSLLLLGVIAFSIINFHNHYGMHLVNRVHSERLAATSPQQHLLIYQELGSAKKHSIVIYRHNASGPIKHTKADASVANRFVRTNSNQPRLKVIHNKYVYRTHSARLWFGLAMKSQNNKTTNVFYVPKGWAILSANQAKVLKQSAKNQAKVAKQQIASPQAKMQAKQKTQAYVQAQMMKALQKDPQMSSTKKKTLMKKFTKKFQVKIRQQSTQDLIQKALVKAKETPVGYVSK